MTSMCLGASFCFLVCITPSIVLLIGRPYWDKEPAYHLAKGINNQLVFVNHSVNFFLYCVTGRRFRQVIISLFCCRGSSGSGRAGGGPGGRRYSAWADSGYATGMAGAGTMRTGNAYSATAAAAAAAGARLRTIECLPQVYRPHEGNSGGQFVMAPSSPHHGPLARNSGDHQNGTSGDVLATSDADVGIVASISTESRPEVDVRL